MIIHPFARSSLTYIALHLREWDRRELFATRWSADPNALVEDCMNVSEKTGAVCYAVGFEKPVAVIGLSPIWPGAYSAWCFATDEFDQLAVSLTKLVKRSMIPAAVAMGGHWAECRSIEGHDVSHRWLTRLGFKQYGPLACGKNGENFFLFGWNLTDNKDSIDVF